jgi:alginate O-acetyltransferase complex protein AlgI
MGGNRVKTARWIINMMTVWFLTGLWHGASWNFVLWGVYFGVILIIEKLFLQKTLLKIPVINHIYAIAAFLFGWIIFRAESVAHIGTILSAMFGASGGGSMLKLAENGMIKPMHFVMLTAGIICSMPISRKIKSLLEKNGAAVWAIDIASFAALIACIITLAQGAYNPFIYFRF